MSVTAPATTATRRNAADRSAGGLDAQHHRVPVEKRERDPQFGGRVAFVDDYDLHVAHFLGDLRAVDPPVVREEDGDQGEAERREDAVERAGLR